MITLTDSEKSILDKKLNALRDFSDAFNNYGLSFSRLVDSFNSRELCSKEFLDRFESVIKRLCPDEKFYRVLMYVSNKGEITSNYSDYIDPLLERIETDFIADSDYCYTISSRLDYVQSSILKILVACKATAESAMAYIFENQAEKLANKKGVFINKVEYIGKIITNLKIDDSESFIKSLQALDSDCKVLPLLIANDSLKKDEKINVLKMGYRQKDLPKYKSYLKENIKSFDDLDVFIEATILQNNRVKEKEDNIVKIFKDFFVDGSSSREPLSQIRKGYNSFPGAADFKKKYSKYFLDSTFIKRFFYSSVELSTNHWYRSSQYEKLLQFMLSDLTLEEKLVKLGEGAYYRPLVTSLPTLFKQAERDNNLKHIELLINAAYSLVSDKTNLDPSDLYSVLRDYENKDQDNYEKFIKSYYNVGKLKEIIDNALIVKYYNNGQNNRICKNSYVVRGDSYGSFRTSLLKIYPDECLKTAKFMEDDDLICLGLPFEKLKSSLNRYSYVDVDLGDLIEDIHKFYELLVERFLMTQDVDVKKAIAERFFKVFENEDNIGKLSDSMINISTTKGLSKTYNGWNASKAKDTVEEICKQLVNPIKIDYSKAVYNEMKKFDPENYSDEALQKVVDNFTQLSETISLICAVNV